MTLIPEKNTALHFYNKHFCLFRKSDQISFNKAIEEFEGCFKIVES